MAEGVPVDPSRKCETVAKIRDHGMRVTDAAPQYNDSSKSIYTWLREGVVDGNRNLIFENNKLKKRMSNCRNAEVKKLAILDEVDPEWHTHYAGVLGVDRTGLYRAATTQLAADAASMQ